MTTCGTAPRPVRRLGGRDRGKSPDFANPGTSTRVLVFPAPRGGLLQQLRRQAIHRGTFASVRELMIKTHTFINSWDDRSQPFVWTKTAGQILRKANHQEKSSVATH
jgi:hypothetical protein